MSVSGALGTAAMLDSMGRFVSNVGVPAAITFFLLSQLTPRLDNISTLQTQANTQLTIIASSCAQPRAPIVSLKSTAGTEKLVKFGDQ